jgi:N-acetylneuraminic acid mutarotase
MSLKLIRPLIIGLVALLFLAASPFSRGETGTTEDSWISKAPMPTARDGLGIAVADGKIYAIGGYCNMSYLGINEMYDPATDTWTTKASMPTSRRFFATAAVQNKIYAIAGETGQSKSTYANEVYDPSTNTWENKTPLPSQTEREHLSANVVNGKIYLISGYASPAPFAPYPVSSENNVYDPSTDSWDTRAPIPKPVLQYASAVVGNKIYIIGGRESAINRLNTVNYTQIYDTVTDTWSFGPAMPTGVGWCLGGATTGLLAPKRIYILGGYTSFGQGAPWLHLTQVYNPETNAWLTIGTPATASFAKGGVAVVNDTLYAIGAGANLQYIPIGYIPEFPYWIAIPLFTIATLFTAAIKKHLCNPKRAIQTKAT